MCFLIQVGATSKRRRAYKILERRNGEWHSPYYAGDRNGRRISPVSRNRDLP